MNIRKHFIYSPNAFRSGFAILIEKDFSRIWFQVGDKILTWYRYGWDKDYEMGQS